MADLSKIRLNGDEYYFKDAASRESLVNSIGRLIPYGYCTTAAATVAKVVTVAPEPVELAAGLTIAVKFQYANTGSNPTLNVNNFGAIAIKRYGTTAPGTSAASNWNANSIVILTYDGTYWQMDSFNNTTYSGMTDAEYQAGTSTTNRLITPARLKAAIQLWAPIPENVSVFTNDAGYLTNSDISYPVTSVNGQTGTVELSIPTKTSDLTNDSNFIRQFIVTVTEDDGVYSADKTLAQITEAYNAGYDIVCHCVYDGSYLPLLSLSDNAIFELSAMTGQGNPAAEIIIVQDNGVSHQFHYFSETDPTVPAWAKAETKPTYTAAEVGAISTTHVANTITSSNITSWNNKLDSAVYVVEYNQTVNFSEVIAALEANKEVIMHYTYGEDLDLFGHLTWIQTASNEEGLTFVGSTNTNYDNIEQIYHWSSVRGWTSNAKSLEDHTHTTLQTTAGSNNTEYNLIGTATSNTNNSAVNIYNPGSISFAKTTNEARLTLGSSSLPGKIRLYSNVTNATGYTELVSGSTSTNTRTITFPDKTGTVALTSDIPSVPNWAMQSSKPSYAFSELTSHPTTINDYGITDAYTKTEVDGLVNGVLHYKGAKANTSALPSSGNAIGDVWHITADGSEWAWDGTEWQELGSTVDLSGYLQTGDIAAWAKASTKPSYTASEVGALPSNTTYVSTFNGQSGAITYIPPVTSVNNQTGAVSITPANIDAVAKTGDTMTGDLILNNADIVFKYPTNGDFSTTLSMVGYNGTSSSYTPRVGFNKSTILQNINNPSANTDAANKAYVDNAVASVSGIDSAIYMLEYGYTVDFDEVINEFNSGKSIIVHRDYGDLEIYGSLTHISDEGTVKRLKFLTNDNLNASGSVYNVTWIWSSNGPEQNNGWDLEEISLAKSSHVHGYITNSGTINTSANLDSGDRFVFADSSDSGKLTASPITFGTSTTQYLANNGTWQNVPTTTVTQTLTSGTAIGTVGGTTLYAPTAYDDSALAARVAALEAIPWVTYHTGNSTPSNSFGNNGDLYLEIG